MVEGVDRTRRVTARAKPDTAALTALLVAMLAAVVVGCSTVAPESGPQSPEPHPEVAEGQPCSSCKAVGHDHVHDPPFDDPDCATCHTYGSWRRVAHVHAAPEFNEGLHAIVGCPFCHTEERPRPSPDCYTCHTPSHPVVRPCANCHAAVAWRLTRPLPARHVSLARGHARLTCFSCHRGRAPFLRPRRCVSCHGVRHGGLTECADCHDPARGWAPPPDFQHNRFFRLTGRHATLPCARCHPNNRFKGLGTACASCHGVQHGGLVACADCHTTAAFRPSTFRHATRFRLTGRHARVACARCHPRRAFAEAIGSPSACVNCHGTRHGGLRRCDRCHTTAGFVPSTFRHASVFRLTGRHDMIPCESCHPRRRFAQVIASPSACVNCHGVHHGNQRACEKCHTTATFERAKRVPHPVPPPLGGEHARRPCRLCHPRLVFNEPVRPCVECHAPVHIAPRECVRCHTPTRWAVGHPEIGYHTTLPITAACQYCHPGGEYPEHDCSWCHR